MKLKTVLFLIIAGLGLSLSSVGCTALEGANSSLSTLASTTPTVMVPVAVSSRTLSSQALGNLTYQIPEYGPAQMAGGFYAHPTAGWQARMMDMQAIGDLNGNGTEDAAVLLWATGGGSGRFIYLATVVNDNGSPRNTSTVLLGDRVRVESVTIANQQVIVQMITQGENDPACCPTLQTRLTYELRNNQLQLVNEEELGSVGLT